MKKFNKNMIVFISVSLFLIIGLFESGLYIGIYESFYIFSDNEIPNDMKIEKFIDEIENAYTEKLSYHNAMLDLNSLVLNETGTDYVKKDSDIVVKASNDYLAYGVSKMDDEIITKYTDNISGLYEYTKANNIPDVAVEKVRETLVDFCQHNLTIEQQCQANSLPTMIMLVENFVKKYS